MPDRDVIGERGRSLEEDYFRKKDRELVEKLRRSAEGLQAREALARIAGVSDPAVLQELQDLGFTPETIGLLPLVPSIQVAWAEGGVSKAERDLIVSLARARGVEPGSAADRQLDQWLTTRPPDTVFAGAGRLIRAVLDAGSNPGNLDADDLVRYSEQVAQASGGVFGIGKVSAEEKALLARIAAELKGRQ
jgi:hypothetical protein